LGSTDEARRLGMVELAEMKRKKFQGSLDKKFARVLVGLFLRSLK
jgi:hypothetical protein